MSEPSKLHVKVSSESHRRPTRLTRLVTLDLVKTWIRKLELDEYTINGLIDIASKYPQAALPSFRKNINLMIQRVRAQRQKDLQGEENANPPPAAPIEAPVTKSNSPSAKVWDTGPQKVGITAEDLQEEWETESVPEEGGTAASPGDPQQEE